MNWREHITADPMICHGHPCFSGTRVLVSVVLDCLAAEMSVADILEDFPGLSSESVRAALAYSSDLARDRVIAA